MIDVISVLISATKPSVVSVWTWAIADYEVECFEKFMSDKDISGGLLVIDRAAENRNAEIIQRWRDRFGDESVKVCQNHAKISTVEGQGLKFLARGSMNLNCNPRFEQLDITEGGEDFDLVRKIEGELKVLRAKCDYGESARNSQVGKAFEKSELELFKGIKTWRK